VKAIDVHMALVVVVSQNERARRMGGRVLFDQDPMDQGVAIGVTPGQLSEAASQARPSEDV
jgi:hypothetical protein